MPDFSFKKEIIADMLIYLNITTSYCSIKICYFYCRLGFEDYFVKNILHKNLRHSENIL